MIAEFKVTMSNFSAENQKGPAVISSVSKSGGRDFHGSGYFYARHYALNANDSYSNANNQARPQNKYFYPGGTLGAVKAAVLEGEYQVRAIKLAVGVPVAGGPRRIAQHAIIVLCPCSKRARSRGPGSRRLVGSATKATEGGGGWAIKRQPRGPGYWRRRSGDLIIGGGVEDDAGRFRPNSGIWPSRRPPFTACMAPHAISG
jgi:hypothetical protein